MAQPHNGRVLPFDAVPAGLYGLHELVLQLLASRLQAVLDKGPAQMLPVFKRSLLLVAQLRRIFISSIINIKVPSFRPTMPLIMLKGDDKWRDENIKRCALCFPVFWRYRKAILFTVRGENIDLFYKSGLCQTCFSTF